MRRFLPVLALGLFTACGTTDTPDPAPATTASTPSSSAADTGSALVEKFNAANGSAAWFGNVERVELDGKAVIVRSKLAKKDGSAAVPMCDAALAAAKAAGVDFQSVTVRSAEDSSIATQNSLRGETACRVA